jgi:GNAT superfamily N-acetyltransferase
VAEPGRWQALLADPGVSILMADEGGEVVGYAACGVSRDPAAGPGSGELRTLFVVPRHWSGGVGRALVAAALDDLRERGYSEATVWSFAANDRANAFYEANGFARDGAERTEEVWANILEVRYRRGL